jgi:hypothetical protein
MPRAKAFNRSEVERRSKVIGPSPRVLTSSLVDSTLIEKLVDLAGVGSRDSKAALKHKLAYTIEAYRARVLANQQESPARILAALKPGVKPVRKLLAWLKLLPAGVLIELQAGGLEEHLQRIIDRANYWRRRAETHRPAGEADAGLALRRSLIDIFTAHCPDVPEQKRRGWVAFACRELGAPYPNEKKYRQRFRGEHRQKRTAAERKRAAAERARLSALQRAIAEGEGEPSHYGDGTGNFWPVREPKDEPMCREKAPQNVGRRSRRRKA